jgi:hypothetical protein
MNVPKGYKLLRINFTRENPITVERMMRAWYDRKGCRGFRDMGPIHVKENGRQDSCYIAEEYHEEFMEQFTRIKQE